MHAVIATDTSMTFDPGMKRCFKQDQTSLFVLTLSPSALYRQELVKLPVLVQGPLHPISNKLEHKATNQKERESAKRGSLCKTVATGIYCYADSGAFLPNHKEATSKGANQIDLESENECVCAKELLIGHKVFLSQ